MSVLNLRAASHCFAAITAFASVSYADGTEILGAPSIPVAAGTRVALGGAGCFVQPAALSINVPPGAILQVLAYWEGQAATPFEQGATDSITLNGQPVTGTLIGGPTHFFNTGLGEHWTSSYRADVTSLNLVTNGANVVQVNGLDFVQANNGLGLMVVVDDGSGGAIEVRDGNDCAFFGFGIPLTSVVPQTFAFAASTEARTAKLGYLLGSVAHNRPTLINVYVDNLLALSLADVFGDTVTPGDEFDAYQHDVAVPAGATSVTVEVLSADSGTGRYAGLLPASLTWIGASFELPPPPAGQGGEGCTPGFWKSRNRGVRLWDGLGTNDVTTTIKTFTLFNATFGVTEAESGLSDSVNLLTALSDNTNQLLSALNRHAAAALANADASVLDYLFTVAQVIEIYRSAVVHHTLSLEVAKNMLADENQRGCEMPR